MELLDGYGMVSGRCGVWDWEEVLWPVRAGGSDHGRCTGVVEYPGGGTGVSDRGVRGYLGCGC